MNKSLEEHVNAINEAKKFGILGVHFDKSVHVTGTLLIELAGGKYSVEKREDCEDYPFEVSTEINGYKYFSLCTPTELKNNYGGNANEFITTD